MGLVRNTSMSVLLVLLCCFCLESGFAIDTLTSSQSIKDPNYIISNGSVFKLGFFSPVNSTNRYLGIWYNNISMFTVVWVANREKPLKDSSGVLTISEDGNLVVLDGQKDILWSSNVTNSTVNSSAQLLDSGNLVLRENTRATIIWESFKLPTDTFLQTMRISANARTGEKVQLTSWKSPSDPSTGIFSCGIRFLSLPQAFIWKDGSPYWRSGPWNSRIFIGIPDMYSVYHDGYTSGFNLVEDEGTFYLTYSLGGQSFLLKFALNSQGNFVETYWDEGTKDWEVDWSALQTDCDVYGKCGAFASCNPQNSPICSCLEGFEPKNIEEWNGRNWTSGCVRRTPLQCGEEGNKDGFLILNMMKVPDFADWSSSFEEKCREKCLENCSCLAYAFDTGVGCMSWTRNLIDTQQFSKAGVDLYIRVASSELGEFLLFSNKIRHQIIHF
jgi:hypothetical protein